MKSDLPSLAEEFLRTQPNKRLEPVLRRFHLWVAAKPVTLSGLSADEVDRFFNKPFRKLVSPRTARVYANQLIGYLSWLYAHEYLGFDPKQLRIRRRRPLPMMATEFLSSLEHTHRPSTCQNYAGNVRRFHEWLAEARLKLNRLTRPQLEQWLLSLHDAGLHPSTRTKAILDVRAYLRWIFERGELERPADELVRRGDLPKLPQYLPRPLPPAIDGELQGRLRQSSRPLWLGLLLMRETGLRVGELRNLEFGCVREDSNGNQFLKVPLGKLNSERLVPIAEPTAELVRRLQLVGPKPRTYLLERASGGQQSYDDYMKALRDAAEGLPDGAGITTHRLRHTYATTLLSGGMSLLGVMKLLGHRDYRMTLRYTAITEETIGREYRAALRTLENRYANARQRSEPADADPLKALDEISTWLKRRIEHEFGEPGVARALNKRLIRLRNAIAAYAPQTS